MADDLVDTVDDESMNLRDMLRGFMLRQTALESHVTELIRKVDCFGGYGPAQNTASEGQEPHTHEDVESEEPTAILVDENRRDPGTEVRRWGVEKGGSNPGKFEVKGRDPEYGGASYPFGFTARTNTSSEQGVTDGPIARELGAARGAGGWGQNATHTLSIQFRTIT